jgi:hypothetical protein
MDTLNRYLSLIGYVVSTVTRTERAEDSFNHARYVITAEHHVAGRVKFYATAYDIPDGTYWRFGGWHVEPGHARTGCPNADVFDRERDAFSAVESFASAQGIADNLDH